MSDEWTRFVSEPYCPECGEDLDTDDLMETLKRDRCRATCCNCGAKLELEAEVDVEWRTRVLVPAPAPGSP